MVVVIDEEMIDMSLQRDFCTNLMCMNDVQLISGSIFLKRSV